MNIQEALSLDVVSANKKQLQQANKILTRALNRQLLGFKYGSTKKADTTKAGFFQDFMKAHGGKYQISMNRKGVGPTSRNELAAHVNELKKWMNRKDSSVRKWKANLNNPPKVIAKNPDLNKQYKKLSIDDKSLFWRWFSKSANSLVIYDSETLITAVQIVLKNPSNATDLASTVDRIKEEYEVLDNARKSKNKPFKR